MADFSNEEKRQCALRAIKMRSHVDLHEFLINYKERVSKDAAVLDIAIMAAISDDYAEHE